MRILQDVSIRISGYVAKITSLIFLFTILASCAAVSLPSGEQIKLVKSGKCAFVLLRVTSEIDSKKHEAFGSLSSSENFRLGLGGFETGGEPRQIIHSFLSDQTKKDGWTYFIVEPGEYYLAVLPPRSGDVWSFACAPTWRLEIPFNTAIVYVGSIHMPVIDKSFMFNTLQIPIPDKIVVSNDEDIARKIAADFFPDLGTPKTILMKQHQGPKIFRIPNEK